VRRESGKGNRIEPSGVTRIREGRGGRTDAVERSLVAEALALERPRETQLRHIASGADLAAAPRASRGGSGRVVGEGEGEGEKERSGGGGRRRRAGGGGWQGGRSFRLFSGGRAFEGTTLPSTFPVFLPVIPFPFYFYISTKK
jgi:hypothetical protein